MEFGLYLSVGVVRKAVKATVVLLPLLGVIYVIFLVNPSDHEISEHIFAYFNNVLQSSQVLSSTLHVRPFTVAAFYCHFKAPISQSCACLRQIANARRKLVPN